MNSSPWQQSYNQQPYLSGGSPLLPPSTHEDTLNNFPGGNANSFLPSSASCQDLQPLSSTDPSTLLSNACYESLLSPAVHSSKETAKYYNDDVFNGVCKENQSGMQNFLQCPESRNEGSFPNSNTNSNYTGQVPSISFNSSSNIDQPSPSPFGVLPHLAVKPAVSRSHENFISPVSKTVSAYNNGPYTERENNNNILHNPLSNSSSFSADTATPSPAALNSLSSNFSSPSNDYNTFSPQTMGAYNKPVHSPMPQSPSVAHHSYPSSPYTNIDSVGHISAAPPCSPMNGGTYVNNLNAVPVRNGLHKPQMASSNNSAISNNVCYTPQSHIGPIPGLSKTPDYHPDYNTYAPDRISPSSYSSGYSSMHSSRMSNDSRTSLSPRGNSNIPHEAQIRYGHLRSAPSATVSSPTYMPNNIGGHDIQYPPSNMQPPSYMPCPPPISTRSYPGPPTVVSNSVSSEDPYAFPPSEMVDDKGALEMFNCHVELGTHAPVPYSNYPDNDLQILNADSAPSNRMLRSSKANDSHPNRSMHYTNANKSLVQQPMLYGNDPVKTERQSAMPNYYGSVELGRMENPMFDCPKRRGARRGRRRGGNTGCRGRGRRGQSWRNEDRNVYYYDASYSRMNDYNSYQQVKKEPESIPFPNTAGLKARISHLSDMNNQNNNNNNSNVRVQRFPYPYGMIEIKIELGGLVVQFHTRRRNLRSCTKRETKFMAEFLLFLKNRLKPQPGTVWPPKCFPKKPEPKKAPPKDKKRQPKERNYSELRIKIKVIDPKKRDKWCCMRGTSESPLTLSSDEEEGNEASTSTVSDPVLLSSHQIKQEIESEEESSQTTETGNCGQVTGKRSAETKSNFKSVSRGRHLNVTNSETLPAGKVKVKPENASPAKNSAGKEQPTEAKKLGKKIKSQPSEDTESNTQTGKSTLNGPEPTSNSSVIKSEETQASEERLGVLRRSSNSTKEPKPGSSIQEDLVDDISDNFDNYDNFDDSDSDPAWTPSAKSNKATDTAKAFSGTGRKRGAKTGRKSSATKSPAKKRKAAPQGTPAKKKRQCKPKPTPVVTKASETRTRGRKDTGTDRFLIAKADINIQTPFIWKVDRKSSMLQRFEISEQNGVLLYHSSFTYAAGNQFCVSNYVTAVVKALSPDTVQYLGPNLSETAEMALAEIRQAQSSQESSHLKKENFDYLKEDFTVYIQSLLSQDVDSSFLHEIKKFNDEYFLIPIQNLETVSEGKKEKLLNEFWNEELKKSINTYPHVNILDSGIDNIKCQACERTLGNKLLQFFGQAYNSITLEHMDLSPPVAKTQFSVCDNCSISVSLYSRLHHHKYNLFVECHSKASEVKANNDNVQSHEDVLKLCLEDTVWIEKIFADQVQIWRDCEKDS